MKIYRFIIFIIMAFLLLQCASRKELTELTSKNDEAIIAGKILVYYNGIDVTDQTSILFNEIMWGKYSYKANTDHILLTKLPLGDCHISRLAYKSFRRNIPKENTLITLKDAGHIYYIGDITIDWRGAKSKIPNMFGLVGAIADEMNPDGEIKIYVESKIDTIQKYISEKFGQNIKVFPNIINAEILSDSIKVNLTSTRIINHNYYEFNLKDGTKVGGKLFKKTDDELYVKDKRIVYIIKKEKLLSIKKDGKDVTEKAQNNFKEMNISLFKYTVKRLD